ncbi:helix-turn-helix domain-containing protein [Limnohabitans sp. Rim8]|uniref:helix-turn-helix domain-containing protein n=1 Tax=Limnohabitans sp. Rim8 TaxID=1100718 RepID=UPI0025CE0405|nr:excisionase family DNA-binding protein [Limnohabitans sp. Rim8]
MNETLTYDSDKPSGEFLTSSQAAKRLGLSMATIQKLVDNHVLQAWKTFGGHRRISLASLLNYQSAHNLLSLPPLTHDRMAKVMVVIESPELTAQMQKDMLQWQLPLQAAFQESLTEALLELLSKKHDLLVIQMSGLRKQQEKILEILQKFMSSRNTVGHTLILTPEIDLLPKAKSAAGPASIQVLNTNLSPLWLSAYLSGFTAQRRV